MIAGLVAVALFVPRTDFASAHCSSNLKSLVAIGEAGCRPGAASQPVRRACPPSGPLPLLACCSPTGPRLERASAGRRRGAGGPRQPEPGRPGRCSVLRTISVPSCGGGQMVDGQGSCCSGLQLASGHRDDRASGGLIEPKAGFLTHGDAMCIFSVPGSPSRARTPARRPSLLSPLLFPPPSPRASVLAPSLAHGARPLSASPLGPKAYHTLAAHERSSA